MTRTPRRSTGAVLAPALALLFAACAAGAEADSEPAADETAAAVAVEIRNDLVPPTPLTVRMLSRTGLRSLLGSVPAGATRTLHYRQTTRAGPYRLVAETAAGDRLESREFALFPAARVWWSPRNNTITVGHPEEGS